MISNGLFMKGLQNARCSKCNSQVTEGYLFFGAVNKVVCSNCMVKKEKTQTKKKVSITVARFEEISAVINSVFGEELYVITSTTNIAIKDRVINEQQLNDYINNSDYNVRIK